MADERERPEQPDTELPEDNDSALDFFRAVGKQLRFLRERAGLSRAEAAKRLNYGVDQVSSVEQGRRVPQWDLLERADAVFETGGLLTVMAEDIQKARNKSRVRHPTWFRVFAQLERRAVEIHEYTTMVFPGLLQTEAYARALYQVRQPPLDDATIEKRVTARLARQDVLTTWPLPKATFVIEEAVLYRPIGGREVLRGQLKNLLRAADLRSTELQIMPTERQDHPGLEGPFILLAPKGRSQVAYTEAHGHNRVITDPEEVRQLAARYGSIRAQALGFRESVTEIEKALGAL